MRISETLSKARLPSKLASGLIFCLLGVTFAAHAQWKIDTEDQVNNQPGSQSAPPENADTAAAIEKFEASKCSNGGPETRRFIDFATEELTEQAYVNQIGEAFANTIQLYGLSPNLPDSSERSVRFLFEIDQQGKVKTLTVFAREQDTELRNFVTLLITQTAPFPSFESFVDRCFETVVISAIFDF